MQLCNRAHHNLQIQLFTLKHLLHPGTRYLEGNTGKTALPNVKWAEQLLVPVSCPGYITCSVLGLCKQLPCALMWHTHKTGTLDIPTEGFIHVIKQFISHNMEIALGLCFP